MLPTYYSENKETYCGKETNDNNFQKKYIQTEEIKFRTVLAFYLTLIIHYLKCIKIQYFDS